MSQFYQLLLAESIIRAHIMVQRYIIYGLYLYRKRRNRFDLIIMLISQARKNRLCEPFFSAIDQLLARRSLSSIVAVHRRTEQSITDMLYKNSARFSIKKSWSSPKSRSDIRIPYEISLYRLLSNITLEWCKLTDISRHYAFIPHQITLTINSTRNPDCVHCDTLIMPT